MRGQAIHAMQGQMFGKIIQAEESLQRRRLHARRIGEAHVILDQRENLARFLVGEAEAAADLGAHGDADFDMAVEADAVGGDRETSAACRHRAAARPRPESIAEPAFQLLEQHQGVDPDVAFGMILRRLLQRPSCVRFPAAPATSRSSFIEQFKGAAGVAFGEHLGQLVAHALAAHGVDAWRARLRMAATLRLQREAEARRKANGAQQAQMVLFKALLRVADGAEDARRPDRQGRRRSQSPRELRMFCPGRTEKDSLDPGAAH